MPLSRLSAPLSMPLSTRANCRIYSSLLFLYPSAFRRQFGEEMLEVFSEQMREACQQGGWLGGMVVWRCVSGELLRTVLSSHLEFVGISLVSGLTALGLMCSFFWAIFGH
jgi:hypothetical protein